MLIFGCILGGFWLLCTAALPLLVLFDRMLWNRDQRRLSAAWSERHDLEMAWLLPAYQRERELS